VGVRFLSILIGLLTGVRVFPASYGKPGQPPFAAATSSTLPLPETNLFRLSFVPHACALAHKYALCHLKLRHVDCRRKKEGKSFPPHGERRRMRKKGRNYRTCDYRARSERATT